MKIVTIAALKGGVGKTNFAFNLATFLAIEKKKKVLVIDLDPQANLTHIFKVQPQATSAMELFNEVARFDKLIMPTNFKNIMLIPTSIDQEILEFKLAQHPMREKVLHNFFKRTNTFFRLKFDYVIIDTNPSWNLTNINAYAASDSIVLVSDNSIHSMRSLELMNEIWSEYAPKLEIPFNIKGIVFNNFDHLKISQEFKDNLMHSKLKDLIVAKEIRRKTVFKRSEMTGEPVVEVLRNCDNPYVKIVADLEKKGAL